MAGGKSRRSTGATIWWPRWKGLPSSTSTVHGHLSFLDEARKCGRIGTPDVSDLLVHGPGAEVQGELDAHRRGRGSAAVALEHSGKSWSEVEIRAVHQVGVVEE